MAKLMEVQFVYIPSINIWVLLKYFIKIQIVRREKNKRFVFYIFLVTEHVICRGSVTFQSFTFTPRLLQRTIDMRHVCFSNILLDINRIPLYINTISMPYKTNHFEFYQNDKQTIIVEYNEDIGKNIFSKEFI